MLQHGKEEREKQNGLKTKVYFIGPFCFANRDAIKCVIGFMIDSHTMKRGISWQLQLSSVTRSSNSLHVHFDPSELTAPLKML